MPNYTQALPRIPAEKYGEHPSLLDWIPAALHPGIRDDTNVSDLSGYVQAAIDSVVASGGGNLEIPPGTYRLDSGLTVPSNMALRGSGRGASVLKYAAATGTAIQLNAGASKTADVHLENFALTCSASGNTAKAVYCYHVRRSHLDLKISGFDKGIHVSGNDTDEYSEDYWIHAADIRLFTSWGLYADHAIGLHLVGHSVFRTEVGNAAGAWGIIIYTGASGSYIDHADLEFCGLKIQNTMPSVNDMGKPPEFVFAHRVVADTCPTDGIYFDASLDVPDALSRLGKSYNFVDSWASYTQTNGTSGVKILGGQDISFVTLRCRINKHHGIYINGGDNIRLINVVSLGNNIQNGSDGAGLFVDDGAGRVEVIGGEYSEYTAGEGLGRQRYGIRLNSGYSAPCQIIGPRMVNNVTANFSDISISGHRTAVGIQNDDSTVPNVWRHWHPKARWEVGDGGFYLDYKNDGADAVSLNVDYSLGAGITALRYDRATEEWQFFYKSTPYLLRIKMLEHGHEIQVRPDATGLTQALLTSQLDADSAERFAIRGDGRLTWGDGTAVDVALERLATGIAKLTGAFLTNNHLKAGNQANDLGVWLVTKSVSLAGTYKIGLGNNCYFDGTNWRTDGDGSSNGGALILSEYASGNLKFYILPSTGGTGQSISNANLENYLVSVINSTGMSLPNLKRGTGSPEGVVPGNVGDLYQQTNGSEHSVLWTKCLASVGGDTTLGWRNRGTFAADLEVRYEGATLTRTRYGQLKTGSITQDPFEIATGDVTRVKIAGNAAEVGIGQDPITGTALAVFGGAKIAGGYIGLGGDPSATNTVKVSGTLEVASGDIIVGNATPSKVAAFGASKELIAASMAASRALVSDSNGDIISALTTAADIGYCAGLDSNVQDQLDGKATKGNPGAHTITLAKLTAGGSNGSITWNAHGCVTAYTDPT